MTNKAKRQYRIRNWRDYNSALVRRGSLTLRVEAGAVGAWREQHSRTGRGRRRTYSDAAVLCALTLREVYHLPPRATQGLVRSVLRLLGADTPTPHYTTLSRRAASLGVKLPRLSAGPLHLAIDKTIFSDRLKARGWRRQETELRVRCAALNNITSSGMPQSYAI